MRQSGEIGLSFEYPKHVRFRCMRCALCCGDTEDKIRSVLLLEIEAERVSQKTLKVIGEFAEKIGDSEPYIYRMKKTDEKCVFLKDDSCSIYQIRPLICRFYPFELQNIRNRPMFTYTNECPGIGRGPQLKRGFFEKLLRESMKLMEENAYLGQQE